MNADCANIILQRYPNIILYEPELFTAIQLKLWNDVHVNLFFTGNVVVLGRKAQQRAFEVQRWLYHISEQPLHVEISSPSASPKDEVVRRLVSFLPAYYQKLGAAYFYSYSYKLTVSWLNRITKEGEDDSLIPWLCPRFSS